ncbi:MAG: septal ring lytic transglycosylase RlpA family protein [Actinomycetota bacterium]
MRSSRSRYLRALCGAAAAVVVAASAAAPAAAGDLETIRDRAQSVADRVTALEHELDSLRDDRARLAAGIAAIDQEIGALEHRRHELEAAHKRALARYVDTAVAVYKSHSPTDSLGLILSAKSYSDLVSLTHVASSAAATAERSLAALDRARRATEAIAARVDDRKQRLVEQAAELDAVTSNIAEALGRREATLAELNSQVQRLEARARRQAAQAADPGDELERLLAGAGPTSGVPDGFVGTGVTFEGMASWYGPGFEGNPTANGDIFDPSKFTAASKELPLGSWLFVEHNGRAVVVYVNDRGPYVDGRILDLSQAAAEEIGITGVGWVRCQVILKK